MESKNLADLYHLDPIPWSVALEALEAAETQSQTPFLATTRPDGRPHLAGVGALWDSGSVYFTSGAGTRKSRDIAQNANCSIGWSLKGIDLVIEGTAVKVTDDETLQRLAKRYADQGWPASVKDGAFTAPYMAPSGGPPPWDLYVVQPETVFGVRTVDPGGATRWRPRRLRGRRHRLPALRPSRRPRKSDCHTVVRCRHGLRGYAGEPGCSRIRRSGGPEMRILVACLSAVVLLAGTASAQSPQNSPGSLARPAREPGHVACRQPELLLTARTRKPCPAGLRCAWYLTLIDASSASAPLTTQPIPGTGKELVPTPPCRPCSRRVPGSSKHRSGSRSTPQRPRGVRAAERPCRKLLPAHRLFGDPEPPTGRDRPRVPPEP